MNTDPLLDLYQRAINDPNPGPHLVEDLDLATRWHEGLVTDTEREQIATHLAACASCRVWATDLVCPELFEDHATPRRPWSLALIGIGSTVLALAAAVVLMIVLTRPGVPSELALATQAVDQGRWAEAWDRADALDPATLPDLAQTERSRILELAGYQASRQDLAAKQYETVQVRTRRLADQNLATARTENLRIQAMRQVPAEVALMHDGSLLGHGVSVNGVRPPPKGLPNPSPAISVALTAALNQFPDSVSLLINLGDYQMSQQRYELAARTFAQARDKDPTSSQAWLGLGLAKFLGNKKTPDGLAEFQAARDRDPRSVAAAVNVAVTLSALGRADEAEPIWIELLTRDLSPDLRLAIENRRISSPVPGK